MKVVVVKSPKFLAGILKVFFKIKGITLSYTCQKVLIDKKASPTKIVRLVFSFIFSPLF